MSKIDPRTGRIIQSKNVNILRFKNIQYKKMKNLKSKTFDNSSSINVFLTALSKIGEKISYDIIEALKINKNIDDCKENVSNNPSIQNKKIINIDESIIDVDVKNNEDKLKKGKTTKEIGKLETFEDKKLDIAKNKLRNLIKNNNK